MVLCAFTTQVFSLELLSANRPEGMSIETTVCFDSFIKFIVSAAIPIICLFKPVPKIASTINSLPLSRGKSFCSKISNTFTAFLDLSLFSFSIKSSLCLSACMTVYVVILLPCSAKSLEIARPSSPLLPHPQKTKISFLLG